MTTTTINTAGPATIGAIKIGGYKITLTSNQKGKPVARSSRLLTAGKNKGQYKLLEGYYFETEAKREEWVSKLVEKINARMKEAEEGASLKKQFRANMQHGFEVGQVYYNSWGYDQTNIDFYEVVEVKAKSILLQAIGARIVEGSEGRDCASVKPDTTIKIGEPTLKTVQFYIKRDKKPHYYISAEHGSISLYNKGDKGIYSSWGY